MKLHDVYGALTGEPWRMRPWEVERLTDLQIQKLLFESETKRAEKMEKEKGETPSMKADPSERQSSFPQTEDQYVRTSRAMFGQTADYWRDQWRKAKGAES